MEPTRQKKTKKLRIVIYLYMLFILLALCTVASYTWFSLSRTPRVSDIYMFINSQQGLEVSLTPDAEEWELQLDFRDMVEVTAPLRPVTWSDADQHFYAAVYGPDGRLTGQWEPLNDDRHANKDNADGYYIKTTLYARSGQDVEVELSPAVEVDHGKEGSGTYLIGYPMWNSEEIVHYDGGRGAESAVRIGIRITPVDSSGQPRGIESDFFIYEPNCNTHTDGTGGYVQTPSIDGTPTLVEEDKLILQAYSDWTEADPVQRNVVIRRLGEFITPAKLFSLKAGEMVRLDIYIWLEGQDVDCVSLIDGAQLMASIQFGAVSGGQSGLIPIE